MFCCNSIGKKGKKKCILQKCYARPTNNESILFFYFFGFYIAKLCKLYSWLFVDYELEYSF